MRSSIFALLFCFTINFILTAQEVEVSKSDGELLFLQIDEQQSISSALKQIDAQAGSNWEAIKFRKKGVLDLPKFEDICHAIVDARRQGGFIGHPRDYNSEVSAEEKATIRYIVTSLANKSLIWLLNNKNNLEAAGDRVDHIHPLRFLMCIFTDEELKVGIRNIRNKAWVWSDFMGGLKGSLVTESGVDNIKEHQVAHFSETLDVDINLIYSSIVNHKWEEFVNLLITHIPRKGNHDRYDF